jgi:hypothetical protein
MIKDEKIPLFWEKETDVAIIKKRQVELRKLSHNINI